MKITNEKAKQILESIDSSRIFGVTFIKRTDFTTRDMQARVGVAKGLTGEGMRFDPKQKNLLTVFDVDEARRITEEFCAQRGKDGVEKLSAAARTLLDSELSQAYRNINLEMIVSLRVDGKKYEVNDFPVKDFTFRWSDKGNTLKRTVQARLEDEAKSVLKRETGMSRLPRSLELV